MKKEKANFSDGWKKSQKDRKCKFCGKDIKKGGQYFRLGPFAFCDEECAGQHAWKDPDFISFNLKREERDDDVECH